MDVQSSYHIKYAARVLGAQYDNLSSLLPITRKLPEYGEYAASFQSPGFAPSEQTYGQQQRPGATASSLRTRCEWMRIDNSIRMYRIDWY